MITEHWSVLASEEAGKLVVAFQAPKTEQGRRCQSSVKAAIRNDVWCRYWRMTSPTMWLIQLLFSHGDKVTGIDSALCWFRHTFGMVCRAWAYWGPHCAFSGCSFRGVILCSCLIRLSHLSSITTDWLTFSKIDDNTHHCTHTQWEMGRLMFHNKQPSSPNEWHAFHLVRLEILCKSDKYLLFVFYC